jgi:hypothetical protein
MTRAEQIVFKQRRDRVVSLMTRSFTEQGNLDPAADAEEFVAFEIKYASFQRLEYLIGLLEQKP